MNIEVGKFYRTRDGRKAKVLATGLDLPGNKSIIVVARAKMFQSEIVYELHSNGKYTDHNEDSVDLIDEWKDEKTVELDIWVNVYSNGSFYIHKTKELADSCSGDNRIGCVNFKEKVKYFV